MPQNCFQNPKIQSSSMPAADESGRAHVDAAATAAAAAPSPRPEPPSVLLPAASIDLGTDIDIDDDATVAEADQPRDRERDRATHDHSHSTCLSPACCSRFQALTGLDLRAVKRELQAEAAQSTVPGPSSIQSEDDNNNNNNDDDDDDNENGGQAPAPLVASPSADRRRHGRSVFEGDPNHLPLHLIENKAMALNRIDGPDNLFVGGVFALRRPGAMEAQGITSVLSMIRYSFVELPDVKPHCMHLSIDLDDVEDEDIVVHLPRAVRFIDRSLRGGNDDWPQGTILPDATTNSAQDRTKEETAATMSNEGKAPLPLSAQMKDLTLQGEPTVDPTKPGAVFVHCAMGKSRSVTAVVAYLLWKHPHRYGLTPNNKGRPDEETARRAVQAALDWVRKTREMAEPNPGFMSQLEMWVRMGMPADSDDAVEHNGTYQRWLWEREVEESAKLGKKPDWILFEDETDAPRSKSVAEGQGKDLRCKKCRRVLATQQFIIPHQRSAAAGPGGGKGPATQPCPHHFVEALSWMKPVLEAGELDGRLVCPNPKCGSSIGRYAWQGFKCSCGEWVCPAFSLGASKVDEVVARRPGPGTSEPGAGARPDVRAAALGIRLPPGRQNL